MIKYIENYFDAASYELHSKEIEERIKNTISKLINKEIYKYNWFSLFTVTFSKGEYQAPHIDFTCEKNRPNISSVIYLNNDFEGGEIYFPEFNIEIKPSMNSLIIFNSDTVHGVKEITNGNRQAASFFWSFKKDNND